MHKIKWTNRVKAKLISNLWAQPRVKNCARKNWRNMNDKTNVFEIECCGSSGQLPTERMKQKVLDFKAKSETLRAYEVVANAVYTAKLE
jgi:hypothetical protein